MGTAGKKRRGLRGLLAVVALATAGAAVTVTGTGAAYAAAPTPNPPTGDCQDAAPLNCVATLAPTSAAAGDSVAVTMDPSAAAPSTTASYALLTSGTNIVTVALRGVDTTSRTATFTMPVLPGAGTWAVAVYSASDLQGYGTIDYTGPLYACASAFEAVYVNSTTLCERRFTTDGTLTVPTDVTAMQFLVVGGGGGGGGALADSTNSLYGAGGGGGGAEVKRCEVTVTPGEAWTVVVGSGGAAASTRTDATGLVEPPGANGIASSIARTSPAATCEAVGGFGGGSADGQSSGSGGPSRLVHGVNSPPAAGEGGKSGSGTYAGGAGLLGSAFTVSGGGGAGHGGVGDDGIAGGGNGGAGASLSGTWFADLDDLVGGGGGGGSVVTTGGATGGVGAGGGGNGTSCTDNSGTPSCSGGSDAASEANSSASNSGGGGGGGAADGAAGDGANGVVIARYEYVEPTPTTPGATGAWIEREADHTCAAYSTISAAVGAAQAGDIIHVCPGVYQEPTIAVTVDNLTLVGEGASNLDVRIDGGGNGNPDTSGGHQIVSAAGMSITFQNLTLQNGFVPCGSAGSITGGAAVAAQTVTADGVTFRNNVTCYGSNVVKGGAVSAESASITDSVFTSNGYSTVGGAIFVSGPGTSTIAGSTFADNVTHAQMSSGDSDLNDRPTLGGAVFAESSSSLLTIDASTFSLNGLAGYAPTNGGAVYSGGSLTVTDSLFADNAATGAGGAVVAESVAGVTATTFRSNTSGSDGSAIRATGPLTVDGSTFESNSLTGQGTGTVSSSMTGARGADVEITNSTFYSNTASGSPGIEAQGDVVLTYVTAVQNTTDAETTIVHSVGSVTINNSVFARNEKAGVDLQCASDSTLSVGSSVSDEATCLPVSATASASLAFGPFTYHNGSLTKTLALLASNSAVDAGDCMLSARTVDQSGVVRAQGAECDAGAYEFTGYTGDAHVCPRDASTVVVGTDATTGYPICQRVYSDSGASSFIAPEGVSTVDVVAVAGGGGGGGGGTNLAGAVIAGGGGAGGAVGIQRGVAVTGGASYQVIVGSGGAGGSGAAAPATTRGSDGRSGGASSFETGLTVAGGEGGTGGGLDGTSYVVGAGGATAAGLGGATVTGNSRRVGGAGAPEPAWDIQHFFTAGGGGAGAGSPGSSGLYGAIAGTVATQFSGSGGVGLVPVDPLGLFGSPGWIEDLPSTVPNSDGAPTQVARFGLAPGGGGGASIIRNVDTYRGTCGASQNLLGLPGQSGSGRGVSIDPGSGVYSGLPADLSAPTETLCGGNAAFSFGAGGGGGVGSGDLASGVNGRVGIVVVRYVAGPLPVCGEATNTATSTTTDGVVEMMITGDCRFVAPTGVTAVDAIAIGGGGAGATNISGFGAGGGGGAGAVVLCSGIAATSELTALIGAAGTWGDAQGPVGAGDSVFGDSSCTATGGATGAVGNEFVAAGAFGATPPADVPAAAGNGGTSGSGQVGGTGALFSWSDPLGVDADEFYASAGGGGAGAGANGASPNCTTTGTLTDGKYTGDFTDIACGSSAGGAGTQIGTLTGAASSLFSGDTRTFGGGGGGASSYPVADGTLGTDGGGTGATPASTRGADATAFGGGGGGGFAPFNVTCALCAASSVATLSAAEPSAPSGSGYQGAVIVRYEIPAPSIPAVWIERAGVPLQDATPADTSCANPGFSTITAAVAAASADDVIHVCSGTYREAEITPTVDNLTILGEEYSANNAPQDASTTLSPPVFIDGELTEGDATSRHRIFDATGLKITFKNVHLRNGEVEGFGGAVKAFQVMVEDSVFNDNDAFGGGAIYVSTDGYTTPCVGPIGSVFGPGTLNCAPVLANPPAAPLISVVGSEFTDNGTGSSIDGGALYANGGTVTSNGSTFSGNEALLAQEPPLASDGAGGAILARLVVVYGSTFTGNKALFHGGAIAATTVRVFSSTESPKVASVFDSNEALGDSNSDGYGGALWADQVDVETSSFVSNLADSGGAIASAAVLNTAPVTPAAPVSGTVSVTASTFETNSATVDGGAVLNKAVGGSTTVYNSTFSANHAGNAGGGVYAQDALSVSFSTFDANTAGVSGGVFWTPVAPSVDNNIFSFAAADETEAVHNGCLTYEWTPAKDTTNLTTNYWCPGTVVEAPATLGLSPLADNGGPTETMAIGTSSAALDAADQTECDSRTNPTDQRGNHRPVGNACDAGAYEYFGQVTLDAPPGEEGTFTSEIGVETLHILLVGGGGGGGPFGPNGEAGGGGGGGEVVECTIDLTVSGTEVHYYFGLGGAEGENGESSWVKIGDETEPSCVAAGGSAGVAGGDGPGAGFGGDAGATSPAVGNGGGGAALCEAPADCSTLLTQTLAGGGGGGAGGAGLGGEFDGATRVATGGAGGPGVSPSSVAFGDNSQLYGGGGGGGAYCASVDGSPGGNGGIGGGGDGVTGDCIRRPVRNNPPSYGGGPVGGGGGGAAGTIPGGSGGGGTGEVRTPAPTDSAEQLHVCVKKLYVVYGARYYDPEPFLCVPEIDECAAPTSPTLTPVSGSDPECCPSPVAPSTDSSVSPSDPECCPTVTAPVDGSDPDHCDEPLVAESPFDGFSTVANGEVVDSGLVAELTDSDSDGDEAPKSLLPMPRPLHYEHGIPEGWRKASLDEFPGVVLPTCSTEYEPGDDVTDPTDPATWLPITCEGGDPLEYEFNYEFIDGLRIYPAVLRVKPKHLRVAYGTPEPSPYEFTIKGFKLGETADVLTDLPVCDSEYTDTAEAGSRFHITCSGGAADNYTFKLERSHIHVEKVKVPLRAADRVVTYGDPAPDYSFGLSGLRGPDSALSPERLAGFVAPVCSSVYTSVTSAGTVDIDCVGAASTNYEFEPVKGTVTVRKASLRVLPKSMTVAYGAASPQVGFELSGFVNGETAPGSGYAAPKCSAAGYTATTPSGSSLAVTCSGGSSRNYDLDQTAQSALLVTRATATITADAKTVVYGSAAPGFTYTVVGLKNGETPVSAGMSAANCSSAYTPSTNVGTVPVTCTGASSANYDFTYVPANLTVIKATLRVTPDAKSITYGQAVPALTWSVDGFANGQTSASAAGYVAPTCATTAASLSAAGTYAINCTGGSAANYQFALGSSQVTVNKAVLKATPAATTVVYGSAAPTVGVTVTGFVNGQSSTTAVGYRAPSCTSVGYSMATNAGTYGIACAGGAAANYQFDYTATSTLTVTKAAATITAASRTVTYGTVAPVFGYSMSGLKNSQTAASVAGLVAPVCVSSYTPLTSAGQIRPVSCSGASSTNYTFTYVAGKATVTKATLTVTPDAKTILKGSAIPSYTYTVTGWQNGQGPTTAASYIKPACKSSYSSRSAHGVYTITCSSGSSANYTFVYRTALLTVK